MATFIKWSGGVRSPRIIGALATLAWAAGMWAYAQYGGRWTLLLPFFYFFVVIRKLFIPPIFVVTEGGAGVIQYGDTLRWAPLAGADLEWQHGVLRITWKERDKTRTLHQKAEPALLERVREAARAAEGQQPAGPKTVTIGYPHELRWEWFVAGIILFMLFFGAAAAFDQPLYLLPMAAVTYLLSDASDNIRYLLTPDGLWVARRNQEPVQIPLASLQSVRTEGATSTAVLTSHPDFPVIRLNPYQSSDLITRLKRLTAQSGG